MCIRDSPRPVRFAREALLQQLLRGARPRAARRQTSVAADGPELEADQLGRVRQAATSGVVLGGGGEFELPAAFGKAGDAA
eukprot:10923760-Alexandrium_andersonii.AAC.1